MLKIEKRKILFEKNFEIFFIISPRYSITAPLPPPIPILRMSANTISFADTASKFFGLPKKFYCDGYSLVKTTHLFDFTDY